MKFSNVLFNNIGKIVIACALVVGAGFLYVYYNAFFSIHPVLLNTLIMGATTILFMVGVYHNREQLRYCSYITFGFYAAYIAQKYLLTRWVHPHYTVQIVYVLGMTFLALMLIRALFHTYKKQMNPFELTTIEPLLHLAIVFVVLALGRALIIVSFDTTQEPGSFFMKQFGGYNNTDPILIRTVATDVYLRIYYAIFAALLCAIGFVKRQKSLIIVSLLLLILVVHKIWCLLIDTHGIVDETAALAIISAILVLTVHVYRKYEP